MKVTILSGSPKGKKSVSLQSMNFLSKKFDLHEYEIFHISKNIGKLEKDENELNAVLESVKTSDLVMWVTPVYTFLIPSQFKRFIELVFEKKLSHVFKNKFSGFITTSINFFDHCASNYLRAVSEDLDMKFVGGFAADSYDLLNELERDKLFNYGKAILQNVEDNSPLSKAYSKIEFKKQNYIPPSDITKVDTKNKNILLLQDKDCKDCNLSKMVDTFVSSFDTDIDVINLEDVEVKGGCTGCVQCGFDHKCMYEGIDQFIDFFDTKVCKADILVFAGEIKDRWLSSKWKQFFDRSFFHNHVPQFQGKQLGYIISGPMSNHDNLRHILDAFAQWQGANLNDIVSDEDINECGKNINNLAKRLVNSSLNDYIPPSGFLGKGGHKIFRDDIWGRHRFVFQKDNEWYEKNGYYDFPQYDKAAIEMSENMIKLTKDPEMREAVRKMLKNEMVKPHLKVVEEA